MNLNNAKQAEYEAFVAYYNLVKERPFNSQMRSLVNQLRSVCIGQYGNQAWQEIMRAEKISAAQSGDQQQELKLGKPQGNDGAGRGRLPVIQTAPKAGSPREERIRLRMQQQGGRSAPVVVAGDNLIEAKAGKDMGKGDLVTIDKGVANPVSEIEVETITDISAMADLSAKEILEKYDRIAIYEYLLNAGESPETLDQKTDRQLANMLKKKASK